MPGLLGGGVDTARAGVTNTERDTLAIRPKQPGNKDPAGMFTGDVRFDVIAKGEGCPLLHMTDGEYGTQ